MKILINDANILIDIVKLDIVSAFLSLNVELYTTDFVFSELELAQQQSISSPSLTILKTESIEDFSAIMILLNAHKGLSFEDCSVWHYAQKLNGTLITGDGALRKKAQQSGLDVKGIIYIIEEIKTNKLLSLQICIEKLNELKVLNNRLPVNEIDKRIEAWLLER